MLTLASNERIPLRPHMRMLFELRDLNFGTPATVSRAGIIFVSDTDLDWKPVTEAWIASRPADATAAPLRAPESACSR